MWPEAEGYHIQPSIIKKMPGRPKKKRVRDPHERDLKNSTKLRRAGGHMTCQKCQQNGHNQIICKNEAVEKCTKKRKFGRPRKNTTTQIKRSSGNQLAVSNSDNSIIARERSTAKSGMGVLNCTSTGNIYIHMNPQRNILFVNPQTKIPLRKASRASVSGASGTTTDLFPTQESCS